MIGMQNACVACQRVAFFDTSQAKRRQIVLLMAYGVLLGIMIQFVWLKKSNMMHIEHMLPFLLFLMITLLNRFAYVQKQQYETMLSITNRRHLAKENVIQYERLQKDNDEILRQIHDLRKQMKLLNNKTIEENDTLTKKISEILRS